MSACSPSPPHCRAPVDAMSDYFYSTDGSTRQGPVSSRELRRLAQEGVLARNSLVWKEGLADWIPAERLKGLFASPGGAGENTGTGAATAAAARADAGGRADESVHAYSAIPAEQTDTPGYAVEDSQPTAAGAGAAQQEPRRWYYLREGEQTGPITRSALIDLLEGKIVAPETYVWTEGMADWRPARTLRELFPSSPAPRSVPPTSRPAAQGAARAGSRASQDPITRWLLPTGRSPWAIISGYCGLLGLFPMCGVILAPTAIVTGIVAIVHLRRRRDLVGLPRAIAGIVLGVLGLAGVAMMSAVLLSDLA